MPATSTSPVQTAGHSALSPQLSARVLRRCTDVVRVVEATGLFVAHTGNRCVLECYSPFGTTKVLLPLSVFVDAARAAKDGNGNPWPQDESRAESPELRADHGEPRSRIHHLLEQDAQAVPAHEPRPRGRALKYEQLSAPGSQLVAPRPLRASRERGTVAALMEQAWQQWRAAPTQPIAALAKPIGVTSGNLAAHFRTRHSEEYERLLVSQQPAGPLPAVLDDLALLPSRKQPAERERMLRRAWGLFIASPELSYGQVADKLGCYPSFLRRTFEGFASQPGAPALKPNGKL